MDPESIRVTLKGSTGIRLNRWQDWPLWYDQLKIWCIRNEIWDDVNSEAEGEQPLNQRPVAPQLPTMLDNESRANFQIENAVYTNSLRLWKDKDIALKQLDETIKSTVGNNFKQHLMGKMTERAKLKSLVQQVRPPIASIKADLKAEYEILKATPYGNPVTEYFSPWQILNIKCRAKEHSIFTTGEEDPSLALHEALQPIHPVTSIFRTNMVHDKVNSGIEVSLADEIKSWETFLQSKGIVKFPSKLNNAKNAAFSSVSLDGTPLDLKPKDMPSNSSKSSRSEHPECICGKFHNIPYCNYLNPKRSRPGWWKPNKEICQDCLSCII
ncbi:hypothetical protein K3495_g4907 [Podosphaera aphanis]|nr:hypothetical protein K3495_g4907 [Podosphaera aphanis]